MTEPLPWLAKCVRPMLRAAPGRIFRGADLSSIEGRAAAWIVGEKWKLDAYAIEDMGGPGIYVMTAAGIAGVTIEQVTKFMRQGLGKVPELAFGYEGAVGAFAAFAAVYNVSLEDVADIAAQTATPEQWAKTLARYRPQMSSNLPPEIWTGIRIIVDNWRAKHPKFVSGWYELRDAAISAVSVPGEIVAACDGKIRYLCDRGFLWCRLPSSRLMGYPQPRVIKTKRSVFDRIKTSEPGTIVDYGKDVIDVIHNADGWTYIEREKWVNSCEVWGLEKGQWIPYVLTGGIQLQNICEGVGRDQLADAMKRIDKAGYELVLHAHDEVLCECDLNFGSRQEIENLLSLGEEWTRMGDIPLPLAAKAWEDERYVK